MVKKKKKIRSLGVGREGVDRKTRKYTEATKIGQNTEKRMK